MMQPPPNPIAALFANLRRPQIYGGNPFQMQTQQQAESQVDAVGAPPPAPAPAPSGRRPAPPRGNSFMDSRGFRIADAVLGGATISEARAGLDAQEAAKARAARIAELGAQVEMSPAERLLFEADPETWFKVAGSRLEDRVVADGSTIASGARGASYTNAPEPTPDRIMTGADLNGDGIEDYALESVVRERLTSGQPRPGAPQSQGPAVGTRAVNPNDPNAPAMVWNGSAWEPEGSPRPTSAAPTGAATPQGQGFRNYGEITSFLTTQFPGARITSTSRPQAVQDDLYRRGKTPTRNSTHVEGRGLGTDFVPPVPFSQWPEIARQLEATGRFRRVRVESGQGRNQGTGAHIHLEPR